MKEYVSLQYSEEYGNISISFYIEEGSKPFAVGQRMNAVCEEAYMNGYNWDAFLNAYLVVHTPDLLADLESDPEGGAYFAHYPLSPDNRAKAERLKGIIVDLMEDEERILAFLKEYGETVEWD